MYSRVRLVSAGLFSLGLLCGTVLTAQGASISSITYLGLSGAGNFQEPANVVPQASIKHLPVTNPASMGSRGVRGDRDLAQTFTVSLTDFPSGLDVVGFAIFYEGGPTTSLGTFDVELFPVANATASTLAAPATVSGSLLVSATGLNFATSIAEGTAVFNFDGTVHLDPGAYAWRFQIPGAGTTNLFAWGPTSSTNAYAGGIKYDRNSLSTDADPEPAGTGDFSFGLIQVPEPSSYVLGCMAIVSVGVIRKRNRK
jgi:hypothetical protein